MATYFCRWDILTGNGTGTFADPCWIFDLLDGNTTVPNGGGTIAAWDTIVVLVNPGDIAGSTYSLGASERLRPPTASIFVRPGDSTSSGDHTTARPIIDATSIGGGLEILQVNLNRFIFNGFVLRNGPGVGINVNTTGDFSQIINCLVEDCASTGILVSSAANYSKLINTRVTGCVAGIIHQAFGGVAENISAEDCSGIPITVGGLASFSTMMLGVSGATGAAVDVTPVGTSAVITAKNITAVGLASKPSSETSAGIDAQGGHVVVLDSISVSEGTGTTRFTAPVEADGTTYSGIIEGVVSDNNQSDSIIDPPAGSEAATATDPAFSGGDPYNAIPTADLSGIARVEALGGEPDHLTPGAIQPSESIGTPSWRPQAREHGT
jgi:hypothetical protein